MKKKLLPYILGCAMVAVLPFAAHAETSYHVGTDIDNGTPVAAGEKTTAEYATYLTNATGPDGHNEFAEYNDTSTTNTRAQTFGTPTQGTTGDVTWTASTLGNTRNTTATMQSAYGVTNMNEQQDYRKDSIADEDPTTITEDLSANNFNIQDNDTPGTTDLETAVPEFNMTIPAKTVLPLGATRWRLGNVEINGKYFVRPDKVDVVVTHDDFKHPDYDEDGTTADKQSHSIAFTVADKQYVDTSIESADKYFFQDGTTTKQSAFPYAYTTYTSANYEAGLVSEINETHQVWALSSDWTGKTPGKYTGSITFNAAVVTTDNDDVPSMYTDYYPGEGSETPNP